MRKRTKILIVFSAFFILWIFAAPLLAEFLIVEKTLEKADAILVLSGSQVYLERTQKASELYKAGVSDKILLTDDGERGGWSQIEKRNVPFVEKSRNELIRQGVPAENIEILDGEVTGTIYEAEVLTETAKKRNFESVLLVTSAYHSRRTFATFKQVLTENTINVNLGIASAGTGIQTPSPQTWWLTVNGWQMVGGEYLKILVYRIFY